MSSLRRTASSGVRWSATSNVGRRAISLLTNIVMARILAPEDFGLVAMAALVLSFLELFRDLGTGSAIVQRQSIDDRVLSSIFWLNACFGILATMTMIACAPALGWMYQEPRVVPLLQVMAFSFVISALGIVQQGLLTRELAFNQLAKIELTSAGLAASTGIGLALYGFGVWSLVFQVLAGNLVSTLLLWAARRWHPRCTFDRKQMRSVMGYSLNLTAANILNFVQRNADNLIIGRFLGAEALGYYDLAYRLMLYPLQGISAVIGRVMFPLLAQLQNDLERFRHIYLQIVMTIGLLAFPVMFGFLAVREPAIYFLLGERWEPVITLLLFFAPLGAIHAIATTVGGIYMARGRTRLMLAWAAVATVVVIAAFAIGLAGGIVGVAAAYTAASALLLYPGMLIPCRLIGLPLGVLVATLWRPLAAALAMSACVMSLGKWLPPELGYGSQLLVLIPAGAACYALLIGLIFRNQAIYVWQTLKGGA